MKDFAVTPSGLADWLMAQGRHFVSSAEVAELVGVDKGSVSDSLERTREAGRMVSVTKGGWVPVPPEYREAGAPPPVHFIDQLMGFLDHPYYVGLLSAAAFHGASHQAPMVLQVVTTSRLRDRRVGRGRIEFVQRMETAERPCERHNVATGRVNVSTSEVTVLDLVGIPRACGGLSNIATVIGDLLVERNLDVEALADLADRYPAAVVQRAGHLIEFMAGEVGVSLDVGVLAELVAGREYIRLSPGMSQGTERDERWRVQVNSPVEHDL